MNNQLPMDFASHLFNNYVMRSCMSHKLFTYQESQLAQLNVNYFRAEDLKSFKSATRSGDFKAVARIVRGDNLVGYCLKHESGTTIAMKSDDIKKAIKSKYISVYNLKFSSDGKLLYEPAGDRLGLDIPPEIFFDYSNTELNLRMYYDSKEKRVVLGNTKTTEYLEFRIKLYNYNRAWYVNCYGGNMIDSNKVDIHGIYDVVYRDMHVDEVDKFVNKIITIVRNSKAKATTLEEDYNNYFEQQWERRFSYLDDYLNGHSEDREKACDMLNYLKKNYKRYGKNWDLEYNGHIFV